MYSLKNRCTILSVTPLVVLIIAFLIGCAEEPSYVSLTPQSDNLTAMWDSVEVELVDKSSIFRKRARNYSNLKIYYLDTFLIYDSSHQLLPGETLFVAIENQLDDVRRITKLKNVLLSLALF